MTAVFAAVIVLSLLVALASRPGRAHQRAEDFFVASGQFGAALFFFLAVGETYSIASILGFPGGITAHGTGFIVWFLGYILLSFPVGYFLYPSIWRAGRRTGAVTLPDLFAGHFSSRSLEVIVTLSCIAFLIPLGVVQFAGLNLVLADLRLPVPRLALSLAGGGLAFSVIAISGIRAPAYVAVLKDALVLGAILLTGLACLAAPPMAHPALALATNAPTGDMFAITTILLQCVGFCVVPQTCAFVFTARSVRAVRRAQIAMPLYMVMFPFLIVIAFYAVHHGLKPAAPDDVLLATARALLPGWAAGLVMAGAALSALVILAGICLAIGPLVTRNLVPGLTSDQQQFWAKLVMAIYLGLAIAGAAHTRALMASLNNFYYFGMTQMFPGVLAIILARRTRPVAIIAGLAAGDALAIGLHASALPLGGCNPGLIGLAANLAIVFGTSRARPAQGRL